MQRTKETIRPNFLVIGAAKSGTTSLHHYLGEHPDIFISHIKEPNFFGYERQGNIFQLEEIVFPVTELSGYLALFEGATQQARIGEVSPYYLTSPVAPDRIQEFDHDMRLIAILREPIDRAISGYAMRFKRGLEVKSIDKALVVESHYVEVGMYHRWLTRYYERFPAKNLLILRFDDLIADPKTLLQHIHIFLEVDPNVTTDIERRYNVGVYPRNLLLHQLLTNKLILQMRPLVPRQLRNLRRRTLKNNVRVDTPRPNAMTL